MPAAAKTTDDRRLLRLARKPGVRALRLAFVDGAGSWHSVDVPTSDADALTTTGVAVELTSVEGLPDGVRSQARLRGDVTTARFVPGGDGRRGGFVRVPCDLVDASGAALVGCPRGALSVQTGLLRTHGIGVEVAASLDVALVGRDDANGVLARPLGAKVNVLRRKLGDALAAARSSGVSIEVVDGSSLRCVVAERTPVALADELAAMTDLVRALAAGVGLIATTMPALPNGHGRSGVRMRLSFASPRRDVGLVAADGPAGLGLHGGRVVAGLLHHLRALCAFANPTVNSYKRRIVDPTLPSHVAFASPTVDAAALQVAVADERTLSIETAIADATMPAHATLAAFLAAVVDGLGQELVPPAPVRGAVDLVRCEPLPASLIDAVVACDRDAVLGRALGAVHRLHVDARKRDCAAFAASVTDWEVRRYLGG